MYTPMLKQLLYTQIIYTAVKSGLKYKIINVVLYKVYTLIFYCRNIFLENRIIKSV